MTIHTRDRFLSVNGVDLTAFVRSIEVTKKVATQDTTTTGDQNKTFSAGLPEFSLTVELEQSYAAAQVHATLQPLVGTATAVIARPTDGSSDQVSGDFLISEYVWITGGDPDAVDRFSVTWPAAGTITEA